MSKDAKYTEAFRNALIRTENEGYQKPLLSAKYFKSAPFYSDNNYEVLYQIFAKYFSESNGTFDLSKIKGQCLMCHAKMQAILEEEIGLPTELTVGYINMLEQDFFKFERITEIKRKPTENPAVKMVDLHVWLTLPSLEILDFTFLAHFHYVNCPPEKQLLLKQASNFDFLFGSANRLYEFENTFYHPMYIGKNVLLGNGLIG